MTLNLELVDMQLCRQTAVLLATCKANMPKEEQSLTKPHGQKLRTLNADKVGLTFICNGLGQQSLSTACSITSQSAVTANGS